MGVKIINEITSVQPTSYATQYGRVFGLLFLFFVQKNNEAFKVFDM